MGRRSRCKPAVAAGALLGALAAGCVAAPFEAGGSVDAGNDQSPSGNAQDATVDAPGRVDDAGDGLLATDPSWAQWPMPNSPVDVEAGAPNAQSYTDNADGTVTDNVTSLVWEQTPSAGGEAFPVFAWAGDAGTPAAAAYCATLSLAGHRDWRLPSLIELVSIVDYTVAYTSSNPSINATYFPNTPAAPFWTSTEAAVRPGKAWGVSFDYGYSGYGDESNAAWVRCVRKGGV